MGFKQGKINVCAYNCTRITGEELLEKASQKALPPLNTIAGGTAVYGWAGAQHPLDTDFSPENCRKGAYVLLHLVKAERKPSASRVRAEVQRALAKAAENKGTFLTKVEKVEVKTAVVDALTCEAPVGLSSMEVAYHPEKGMLFSSGVSTGQRDALSIQLYHLLPKESLVRAFDPSTVLVPDEWANYPRLGDYFLTWLASCAVPPSFGVAAHGPVRLDVTGEETPPAISAVLKGTQALESEEFERALSTGKTVGSVTLMMREDSVVLTMAVQPDWALRGLTIPKPEKGEAPWETPERLDLVLAAYSRLRDILTSFCEETYPRRFREIWKDARAEA